MLTLYKLGKCVAHVTAETVELSTTVFETPCRTLRMEGGIKAELTVRR